MRFFSLTALIRLTGLMAVSLSALAVTIARLEPSVAHFRMATPPHYSVINAFILRPIPNDPQLVDAETGQLLSFRVPGGDHLDYATCSPWQDEQGESQIVGRWARQAGDIGGSPEAFGMARYALPSGRVLDLVPLDVAPSAHPCWFPGNVARVLYSGIDGRLYSLTFEGEGDRDGGSAATPRPQALTWRCAAPGGRISIRDPLWPSDPRFGGRLLATLSYQANSRERELSASRIWWLQLDDAGTAVVAAGPLTATDSAPCRLPSGTYEERYANIATTPDGRLTLAYLWQPHRQALWELRLAPVRFDQATATPIVRPDEGRTIGHNLIGDQPPFSSDGRLVYAVLPDRLRAQVVRFETTGSAPSG